MGERLLCKQEVIGSNPFTSTIGTSTRGGAKLRLSARRRQAGVRGNAASDDVRRRARDAAAG